MVSACSAPEPATNIYTCSKPLSYSCYHEEDVKIKTTKNYSGGITGKNAKLCTSEIFPLHGIYPDSVALSLHNYYSIGMTLISSERGERGR